jgi:hypothetical protein
MRCKESKIIMSLPSTLPELSTETSTAPLSPSIWNAIKISFRSMAKSLPILGFACLLLLLQLILFPKDITPPSSNTPILLSIWMLCLFSIGSLSILFQAGWMHVLQQNIQQQLNTAPPTEATKEASNLFQQLMVGSGLYGKALLGYYTFQLISLVGFIALSTVIINLIGLPAEIQQPQFQQTFNTWLNTPPSETAILEALQQWSPKSIQQISQIGMFTSVSVIVLTLFVLLTSFIPSIIVTKHPTSLKTLVLLQLQLLKQYPVQSVFIASFQVVGGCLLPLLLPHSTFFIADLLCYVGTYIGVLWSQALPIAYLVLRTDFPKSNNTTTATITTDTIVEH